SYASSGYIYGYTKNGTEVFSPQKLYVNPAHILALPDKTTEIRHIHNDYDDSETVYNLNGYKTQTTKTGIYISKNRKKYFINKHN
ncbi:MAG: hypothetical protein IKO36_08060, partial [Bacteroidaceae bacterium]|nr:hypothetical protein [Bacteroidaceae bacterium]